MTDTQAAAKFRQRRLTKLQGKVFKVLKAGGLLYGYASMEGSMLLHRLLDHGRNPVMLVKKRTFKALQSKNRIVRNDAGHWIAVKKTKQNGISNPSPDMLVTDSYSVVTGQLLFPVEQV